MSAPVADAAAIPRRSGLGPGSGEVRMAPGGTRYQPTPQAAPRGTTYQAATPVRSGLGGGAGEARVTPSAARPQRAAEPSVVVSPQSRPAAPTPTPATPTPTPATPTPTPAAPTPTPAAAPPSPDVAPSTPTARISPQAKARATEQQMAEAGLVDRLQASADEMLPANVRGSLQQAADATGIEAFQKNPALLGALGIGGLGTAMGATGVGSYLAGQHEAENRPLLQRVFG